MEILVEFNPFLFILLEQFHIFYCNFLNELLMNLAKMFCCSFDTSLEPRCSSGKHYHYIVKPDQNCSSLWADHYLSYHLLWKSVKVPVSLNAQASCFIRSPISLCMISNEFLGNDFRIVCRKYSKLKRWVFIPILLFAPPFPLTFVCQTYIL